MSAKLLHLVVFQADDLAALPANERYWQQNLDPERFQVTFLQLPSAATTFIDEHGNQLDCLIFIADPRSWPAIQQITRRLCKQDLLLPTVIVLADALLNPSDLVPHSELIYHNASVVLHQAESPSVIASSVDQAIALFLQTSPICVLPDRDSVGQVHGRQQQQRLAENLRERLGYLGIYYKRSASRFYRRLPEAEQKNLMQRLRGLYQAIVLDYYQKPDQANRHIDEFVALAFFADLSISQVLELHMQLMDDYAKQLKIEGRNEDILLDYRITLIDVIAHLSEMYRRSIPRETPPETKP